MSAIARAIGVSRPHLSSSSRKVKTPRQRKSDDTALVERIKGLVENRASYGCRRVAARLNATSPSTPAVNHKRAYRVMKANGLLLPKHSGRKVRVHAAKDAGHLSSSVTRSIVVDEAMPPIRKRCPELRHQHVGDLPQLRKAFSAVFHFSKRTGGQEVRGATAPRRHRAAIEGWP